MRPVHLQTLIGSTPSGLPLLVSQQCQTNKLVGPHNNWQRQHAQNCRHRMRMLQSARTVLPHCHKECNDINDPK